MGTAALLGFMSLLLPGYVGLYVSDLVVPAPARSTFHTTAWSLFLSLAGAVVASLFVPAPYFDHLFGTAPLTTKTLVGIGAQMVCAIGVGGFFAIVTLRVLKNRVGQRSLYPTGWDFLWSRYGPERRCVIVETPSATYAGTLHFADDPRTGHALILLAPSKLEPSTGKFLPTGAEILYVPGEQLRALSLSRIEDTPQGAQHDEHAQGHETGDSGRLDQDHNGAGHRQQGAGRILGAAGRAGEDDAEQRGQSEPRVGAGKSTIR